MKYTRIMFALLVAGLLSSTVMAGEWCSDKYNNWNKKESATELRQLTVPATGELKVDGRQNGGISIQGEERADVLVEACVRAWADSKAEALNRLQTTRIETAGVIKAVGPSEKYSSSVSYRIRVPRNTDLELKAMNGGLKVNGVDGAMQLRTVNGGIKLSNVSGKIMGRTTNGGVKVGLNGAAWTGEGLDVETTNGGVKISIPSNFAANVIAGTVNGGFKSDFPELQPPKSKSKYGWNRNKKINASLNGGGVTIRAVTTNGGIKIYRADAQ